MSSRGSFLGLDDRATAVPNGGAHGRWLAADADSRHSASGPPQLVHHFGVVHTGFSARRSSLPGASSSPGLSWLLGLSTALLLFVSVLLHELGHSLVALREGVKVSSITLFLLGGVARVERECSTPMGSFRVAAAGPAVSFVLAGLLLASQHAANHANPLLGNLVAQLGALNLVLALFNLLPGLPLDGGLILKALGVAIHWEPTPRDSGGNGHGAASIADRDHAGRLSLPSWWWVHGPLACDAGLVRNGSLSFTNPDLGVAATFDAPDGWPCVLQAFSGIGG